MAKERISLEPPERTEPIRNWWGMCRSGDAASNGGGEGGDSWSEVVARGVRLGYEVVEEHIRQGERVARQINNQNYTPRAMGNDIWEFAERTARFSMDVASMWWNFLLGQSGGASLFQGNPFFPQGLWPGGDRSRTGAGETGSGRGGLSPAISVQSSRPVEVVADVSAGPADVALATRGLRAVAADHPDLTDVRFRPAPPGGRPGLVVRVPDGQPDGDYVGAVFERDSGRARGTLTVRVGESG